VFLVDYGNRDDSEIFDFKDRSVWPDDVIAVWVSISEKFSFLNVSESQSCFQKNARRTRCFYCENGIREYFFLKKLQSCFANSNPFLNLPKSYENNRKQILVVAFYNFPRESSESRCLKIAQQHSKRLTGFPVSLFSCQKIKPE